jgi:hypothetical protein
VDPTDFLPSFGAAANFLRQTSEKEIQTVRKYIKSKLVELAEKHSLNLAYYGDVPKGADVRILSPAEFKVLITPTTDNLRAYNAALTDAAVESDRDELEKLARRNYYRNMLDTNAMQTLKGIILKNNQEH